MSNYGRQVEEALSMQIKVELVERGMDQKDLASKVGIQPATFSRYMTGKTAWPMPVFIRVAEALEISAADLMTRAHARIGS